jgi:hypothetical protein
MRSTRLLLFLKAYSVLLDDSSSSFLGRRKSFLTRGMKEALAVSVEDLHFTAHHKT